MVAEIRELLGVVDEDSRPLVEIVGATVGSLKEQTARADRAQEGLHRVLGDLAAANDRLDEAGNMIVAGNFIIGGNPQSYVALLNPAGARLWEKEGQVGDEVAGVAAATAQFKNRVFVVGSQRTSDAPVRTDGAIWVYIADGESVFIQPPVTLRAPFTPDEFDPDPLNDRIERVQAVTIHPTTGNALAVGEREFMDNKLQVYTRALRSRSIRLAGSWARHGHPGGPHFFTMQCDRSKFAATRSWPGAGLAILATRTRRLSRSCSGSRPTSTATFPSWARRSSTASRATGRRRLSARQRGCQARPMLRSSPSRVSSTHLYGTRPVLSATTGPVPWPATGVDSAGGVATGPRTGSSPRRCVSTIRNAVYPGGTKSSQRSTTWPTCSAKNDA